VCRSKNPLFPWDELEDHPALATISELLPTILEAELLEGLRQACGRGHPEAVRAGQRAWGRAPSKPVRRTAVDVLADGVESGTTSRGLRPVGRALLTA